MNQLDPENEYDNTTIGYGAEGGIVIIIFILIILGALLSLH